MTPQESLAQAWHGAFHSDKRPLSECGANDVEVSRRILAALPPDAALVTVDSLAEALRRSLYIGNDDDSRQDFGDLDGGALMRPSEAAAAIIKALKP